LQLKGLNSSTIDSQSTHYKDPFMEYDSHTPLLAVYAWVGMAQS